MNLEYKWTREDLKEKLIRKRKTPNIVFFILGMLFFLYITYYGFILDEFDTLYLVLGFILYTVSLLILLFLITKLYVFTRLRRNDKKTSKAYGNYCIEANDETITSTINDEIISYKWKDITKFKKRKNYFFIATREDKLGLLFCKGTIEPDKYDRLIEFVNNKLSK